nr:T9SS type A sorting domain-containing protein [Bacteroidota bacterium]
DLIWDLTVANGDLNGLDILPSGELVVGLNFDDQITLGTDTYTTNGNSDIVLAILSSTLNTGLDGSSTSVNGSYLYPNPTSGLFRISGSDISKVEIVDMLGKILHVERTISFSSDMVIDLGGYPEGAYLVNMFSKGKKVTRRLVIQR